MDDNAPWHPMHADSTDNDLVFHSSDDVWFRADKDRLAAKSKFFAELPELDNSTTIYPIEFPAESTVVDLFLGMIKTQALLPSSITLQDLEKLHKLSEMYDCGLGIQHRIQQGFADADIDPWKLLIWANNVGSGGDVGLAKVAIERFGYLTGEVHPQSSIQTDDFMFLFWERLSELQPLWQLSLIHAVFGPTFMTDNDEQKKILRARTDWTKNAQDFNPPNWRVPRSPCPDTGPLPFDARARFWMPRTSMTSGYLGEAPSPGFLGLVRRLREMAVTGVELLVLGGGVSLFVFGCSQAAFWGFRLLRVSGSSLGRAAYRGLPWMSRSTIGGSK